jgi:hypothetical protein
MLKHKQVFNTLDKYSSTSYTEPTIKQENKMEHNVPTPKGSYPYRVVEVGRITYFQDKAVAAAYASEHEAASFQQYALPVWVGVADEEA